MKDHATPKKPRGRPPVDSEALHVRFLSEVLSLVDQWRRKQKDLPSRNEAVRRLVELGLTVKSPAARAEELAAKAIDKRLPADAPVQVRAARKKKLLREKP